MGSPANITNRSKVAGLGEQPSITNDDPTKEPAWLSDKTHSAHVAALLQACAQPYTPYPHADSIINRDPGDESRALVLPPPSKTLLELIQALEATVAGIRADLDRLTTRLFTPSTAPTPQPHDPMANALAHSEPKPAWKR